MTDWGETLWEAKTNPTRFFANADHPPGLRAQVAIELALLPTMDNERQAIDYNGPIQGDQLPRWPVPGIDHLARNCGGGYGLSVILGNSKCGKTFFALSQCIEAAATNMWQVVYLSAELDSQELAFRIGGYLKANPAARSAKGFLHILHVGRGATPEEVQLDVLMSTNAGGPPILICMDSINTIAELSGRDYLRTLRDYSLWAMCSRRMSNGAASFIVVSETNKLGHAKGGNLAYWADQVIKLEKCDEADRIGMTPVRISLQASRRTPGEGPMGVFLRNQTTGRFQKHEPVGVPSRFSRNSGSANIRLEG